MLAEGEEAADNDEIADGTSDDEEHTTEIQELQESVATIVSCLFQMSMLVRKPAQHDMIMDSRRAEVAMFEPFDYNHVRDKYPRADNSIVERLGLAMTRRRKFLKYRERHALKLKQGISKIVPERDGETIAQGTVSLLSDTIATDVKEPNIRFDDGGSDSEASQTSYAQTLLGGGDITIPKPPKIAREGSPFECPYCHFIITTKGARSWNSHIFQDLQPYMCIVTTRNTPDKLYSTRHEWLHHLKTVHPMDLTPHLENGETAPSFICLLCKEKIPNEQQYDRHVARHLQELALFILPRTDDHDDSDISGGGSGTDEGSNSESYEPESRKSIDLLEELEGYSQILHKRYIPDCEEALKGGEHVDQITRGRLRKGLESLVPDLQKLDLGHYEGLEQERTLFVNQAKFCLTALDNTYPLQELTEDAYARSLAPAALDPDGNKTQSSPADAEHCIFLCSVCGHKFNQDRNATKELKCPNCSSILIDTLSSGQNVNAKDS